MNRSGLSMLRVITFIFLAIGVGGFCYLSCAPDPMMGDFDVGLIRGYRLQRESTHKIDVFHETDSKYHGVPAKVVEIAWTERFIVAKQQELAARGDFPGDELPIPVPHAFKYWIIDVYATNRIGPMSETEFKQKLQSLGQTSVDLKDVRKLRKMR